MVLCAIVKLEIISYGNVFIIHTHISIAHKLTQTRKAFLPIWTGGNFNNKNCTQFSLSLLTPPLALVLCKCISFKLGWKAHWDEWKSDSKNRKQYDQYADSIQTAIAISQRYVFISILADNQIITQPY